MKTMPSARVVEILLAAALVSLVGQAHAQDQGQSAARVRCNEAVDSANRGANRDIIRVENEVERATGRAVESANSCLARVGDILVRSIPGMPTFGVLSPDQVIEMLAGRACSVVASRASDVAGRVTRSIQTVNQSINQGIGQVSSQAGLPNIGRVEIPQGQVNLPTNQPAPRPRNANPAANSQESSGGSIWDRMANMIR